jgi:hypothetical protein
MRGELLKGSHCLRLGAADFVLDEHPSGWPLQPWENGGQA